MRLRIIILFSLCLPASAYALGGTGATCNPNETAWGSCSLETVPFAASVTNIVNVSAGSHATPYQANQDNTKYVLQGDVTADSAMFEVGASYVIIDLNGYTITYNESSAGEGVCMSTYNEHHVAVVNGSIIQGAANSEGDQYGFGNNPVTTYCSSNGGKRSTSDSFIANLYVKYGGRDVGGIIWTGNDNTFTQNTVEDTYEFGTFKNRHQGVRAISGSRTISATGNVYSYNTIINTRHGGIETGNDAEVYENIIDIRSIATNSIGVGFYAGNNLIIRDNTITGTGEHPIAIGVGGGDGSVNYDIYNNDITLSVNAIGEEYGGSYTSDPNATYESNCAAGVRTTWGADDIDFYNNSITITTDDYVTGTYSPTGETAYIKTCGKGMFLGSEVGETSYYHNNTISVTGDSDLTYGVTCSPSYSDGLLVYSNTITSSMYNIVIGDNYGPCTGSAYFGNNTLVRDGSYSGYYTYANLFNGTYGDGSYSQDARIVDDTYSEGAAKTSLTAEWQTGNGVEIYHGSLVDGVPYYDERLHNNDGASTTMQTETYDPAITLAYTYPGDTSITCYKDADGDLYSDGTSESVEACSTGYYEASALTSISGDCDDTDTDVNPGVTEPSCDDDLIDNDCDGVDAPDCAAAASIGNSGTQIMFNGSGTPMTMP